MNAELHFRQAEREALVTDGDAIAAREGQLEPAAQREAVDRRDRRALQGFEAIEHLLAASGSARTPRWRCAAR